MGKKEKAPCLRFKDTNGKDYPAWEQRKFYDCFKLLRNNSLARAELAKIGKIRNIHYGDVLINYPEVLNISTATVPFIAESRVNSISKDSYLENGDIVIADTAEDESVGKTTEIQGITDHKIVSGLHTIPCRPLVNFSPNFLGFLLNSPSYHDQLKPLIQGIKVSSISKKALGETRVCFAKDLDEQAQIGGFFNGLEMLITLHQRKLETLKKLKRTLLQKMFPKKGQLKPELRFPGFTNDWEQRKLGELAATFGYGLNAAAKSFDGRHKYIRITDIDESTRRFLCSSLTSPDIDFEEAAPYRLAEGDVLFARTGASVGKSYRYVRTDGEVYFAGFLIRFRFKDKEAAEFVFQNSLTAKFQNFIKTSSQRSGQPGINAQQFSGYQIAVPNSEERERIGSFFSRLDTAITLHQRKLETYKKLKKSLLQKMFI